MRKKKKYRILIEVEVELDPEYDHDRLLDTSAYSIEEIAKHLEIRAGYNIDDLEQQEILNFLSDRIVKISPVHLARLRGALFLHSSVPNRG